MQSHCISNVEIINIPKQNYSKNILHIINYQNCIQKRSVHQKYSLRKHVFIFINQLMICFFQAKKQCVMDLSINIKCLNKLCWALYAIKKDERFIVKKW